MEACLDEIRTWMAVNLLKLNETKTEYILIGSKFNMPDLTSINTITIGNDIINAVDSVRNIGAVIDGRLTMIPHLNNIIKTCYQHLRSIGQIRKYLTTAATISLIHAFITSKLDNLNSLLYGLLDVQIEKLQLIQNQAARLIFQKKKYDSVSPLLLQLHWLPVKFRLDYKILLLTFKCLHNLAPVYLSELLESYIPARTLRSAEKYLLKEPAFRTETYGKRAFSNIAPRLWNNLPLHVKFLTL